MPMPHSAILNPLPLCCNAAKTSSTRSLIPSLRVLKAAQGISSILPSAPLPALSFSLHRFLDPHLRPRYLLFLPLLIYLFCTRLHSFHLCSSLFSSFSFYFLFFFF